MASNGIIDFDGKQVYVPEWALDDSVQTLIGISKDMLSVLSKQTRLESDGNTEQRKSNETNTKILKDIANNTVANKRGNDEFRENSRRLMSSFVSGRNSFVAAQSAMDTLTSLSSNLGVGIEDLRSRISDTGLGFESYADLIAKNSDVIKNFGNNLSEGSSNFAALSKSVRDSIGGNNKYGISIETLNQMILSEIDIRSRSGKTQEEITAELSTGFRQTLDSITALSVATDTAVEDIVESARKLKSSDAVKAFIESGTLESRRLEDLLPGLSALFSSLGDVGDTLLAGVVESVASNTDIMSYENGRIADILSAGGADLADNFESLIDFMKTALTSGIRGVEEADLTTTVLSNLSSGMSVLGEEIVANRAALEAAAAAGDESASKLMSLAAATQDMSQNATMFSRTLENAKTQVTDTFNKLRESADPEGSGSKPGWLATALSKFFVKPDQVGKETQVGTLYDELSGFVDRFNRAMDDREQFKMVKAGIDSITNTVTSVFRSISSLIREDLTGSITSLIDGIGRILEKIPVIGGVLGGAAAGVSFALGTVVGATEEYAKVMQSMVGVGAGIGSSLEALRNQAGSLGVDLQALSSVVSSNSKAMLVFGTGVNEGSRNFMTLAEEVKGAVSGMHQYGFNNTELLEILAEEAEIRRLTGQSIYGLADGMNELLFQTTAVAELTGIQRRDLLRERQTQAREGIFSGFLTSLEPDIADRLVSIVSTMSSVLPKPFADAFRDAVSMGVDIRQIPEYQEFFKLLPTEIRDQFYNLYDTMLFGYADTSRDLTPMLAEIVTTGGEIYNTFSEFMKSPTGDMFRIQAKFNSELVNVLTEFQKLSGLPTNFAEAISKIEGIRSKIRETEELKLIPAIQDLAQAMKTSVLLTALDVFDFDSGRIVEFLSNMDKAFKGDTPGEIRPMQDAIMSILPDMSNGLTYRDLKPAALGPSAYAIASYWVNRLFGSSDVITGEAGISELPGGAGSDNLGLLSRTTDEIAAGAQLSSSRDRAKYDEELELMRTQNQLLETTVTRVMETNRILENYVRVYKENAI